MIGHPIGGCYGSSCLAYSLQQYNTSSLLWYLDGPTDAMQVPSSLYLPCGSYDTLVPPYLLCAVRQPYSNPCTSMVALQLSCTLCLPLCLPLQALWSTAGMAT